MTLDSAMNFLDRTLKSTGNKEKSGLQEKEFYASKATIN
jgi:hypothetical protein